MDFNIAVLKDAAEAFDKFIDSISKFGKMVAAATAAGADVIEWKGARAAHKKLNNLTKSTTRLVASQSARFIPTLREYVENPTEEYWPNVKQRIFETLKTVQSLGQEIEANSDEIATQDFFKVLVGGVMQRQVALLKISEIPPPKSAEEITALREFLEKYVKLVDELDKANDALRKYIDSLKARGKWPIRGD